MMQQLNNMDSVKGARSEAESKLSSNLVEKIERIEQGGCLLNLCVQLNTLNKKVLQTGSVPLKEQGFTLTKREFRDVLALKYAKYIRGLLLNFPCQSIKQRTANEEVSSRCVTTISVSFKRIF